MCFISLIPIRSAKLCGALKHDKRIIKAYSKYPKWKKILISTIVRVSTLVIMYFGLAHVWLIFNPYGDHFESCNGPVPYTEPWLDVMLSA